MSIVIDELNVEEGHYPYPSCHASVVVVELVSGGKTCLQCGRWAISKPRDSRRPIQQYHQTRTTSNTFRIDDLVGPVQGDDSKLRSEGEDIEVYRQIAVMTAPSGKVKYDINKEILQGSHKT